MWKSPDIYVASGNPNSSTKRRVMAGIIFICSSALVKEVGSLWKPKLSDMASLASQLTLGIPAPTFPDWNCR